ncbi:MAG: hypothetical protein U0670_00490 [Anaerolineae bacterium]
MVYVAEPQNGSLAIADRQSISAHVFDVEAGRISETRHFFVLWSANDHGVVVGNFPIQGDVPRYFYISAFRSNIQEATIRNRPDVAVDGREYVGGDVEDISQGGDTLMILWI